MRFTRENGLAEIYVNKTLIAYLVELSDGSANSAKHCTASSKRMTAELESIPSCEM